MAQKKEIGVLESTLSILLPFSNGERDLIKSFIENVLKIQGQSNDWVAEAVKDVGRSPSTAPTPCDSDTAATLLPILQAQRERFK